MREDFLGESRAVKRIVHLVSKVAQSEATVLIECPTGTGKEIIARMIHARSTRAGGPFKEINCAAIPKELLESEMFGYSKGAFTGAVQSKKGLFEVANGGTLFLDEIGDMPKELQPKLLRFIQEKRFQPLGSNRTVEVDVRIIAATNKDLKKEVERRRFRTDLYYRLSVIPIKVPPLKERKEDIPVLVNYFIEKYNPGNGKSVNGITEDAMKVLINYNWPGNVRELENIIQRAALLCEGTLIGKDDINYLSEFFDHNPIITRDDLLSCLIKNKWNKTRAAQALGISRQWLYRLIKKYNV